MLASRQHSWEIMWWGLVALLALLLVALASQTALYGEPNPPIVPKPATTVSVPADEVTEHWCQGVESFRTGDFNRAAKAFNEIGLTESQLGNEPALHVWRTLVAQARGDTAAAVHGWRTAPLAIPAEIWRQSGLVAVWLDRGQLDEAAEALDNAWDLDRDNALVRYQFGLLHLERAHRAATWLDAAEVHFRLASLGRPMVVPNSAAMYRLAATVDLERAIEDAPKLALDEPLALTQSTSAFLAPRVGDLLRAIGAFEFEANSHVMLGQLFLDGNNLELSELHLDAAAAMGRRTPYGYQEIARGYEEQLRFAKATCASAKAFRSNPQPAMAGEVAANMLRTLGQWMAY